MRAPFPIFPEPGKLFFEILDFLLQFLNIGQSVNTSPAITTPQRTRERIPPDLSMFTLSFFVFQLTP